MIQDYISEIPPKFFSKLLSKNRNLYIDTLMTVYQYFQNDTISFRSDFADVVDVLALHFEKLDASLVVSEEDDEVLASQPGYKELARTVLNVLSKNDVGWFEVEAEASEGFYNRYIEISPYASRLADFLESIHKLSNEGFTKAVVDIYRNSIELTKKDSLIRNPYQDGLDVMYQDSRVLSMELRRMTTDIKKFIQATAAEEKDYGAIALNIIDFSQSAFLRDYTRFCRAESFIFYREEIVKNMRMVLRKKNEELIIDCQLMHLEQEKEEISEEQAKEEINEKILQIINFMENDIPRIINTINRKIVDYTNIINQQLKLKRNFDTENAQKLVEELLKYIVNRYYADKLTGNQVEMVELEPVFALLSAKYLSEDSLYTPKVTSKKVQEPMLQEVIELTEEDKERIKKEMYEHSFNPYAPKRCIAYAKELLADKDEIDVGEIPLASREDVLKAVMMFIYSEQGNYETIKNDGVVQKGNAVIQNFTIRNKEK